MVSSLLYRHFIVCITFKFDYPVILLVTSIVGNPTECFFFFFFVGISMYQVCRKLGSFLHGRVIITEISLHGSLI